MPLAVVACSNLKSAGGYKPYFVTIGEDKRVGYRDRVYNDLNHFIRMMFPITFSNSDWHAGRQITPPSTIAKPYNSGGSIAFEFNTLEDYITWLDSTRDEAVRQGYPASIAVVQLPSRMAPLDTLTSPPTTTPVVEPEEILGDDEDEEEEEEDDNDNDNDDGDEIF